MTRTRSDSFGRLIRVDERTLVETGRVRDDDVCVLARRQRQADRRPPERHDAAGPRPRRPIAPRSPGGSRTWKYGYDKNGNLTSEQVPGSPSPPLTDAHYTSTIAYDALDRPASKLNAPRALSTADQALFASDPRPIRGTTARTSRGGSRYWRSFAPGATTPAVLLNLLNDGQGLRTKTQHQLTLAGFR